jgi:AcrR family transcriptional regulator
VDEPVLSWGAPHAERADAARNRRHLLATAREMLAEQCPDTLTMDGLAERAGLGKGTVFRRFGTRAGIFAALLDDDEKAFQQQVLAGPPPLGPGAAPLDRLIAYGRARTRFLITHRDIARAAWTGTSPSQPDRKLLCPRRTSGSCSGR